MVLEHIGMGKSYSQKIKAWSSIAHLADQYETVAQEAQAEHITELFARAGLDHGLVDELTESETFGSIVATLRRAEAAGHRPERLIDRALKAGPLTDADDPASLLRHRVQQLATRTSPGRGRGTRRRFIAGFIPEASGSMPEDMTRALTELRSLIEQRAQALADDALTEKPPWLKALGPEPRPDSAAREPWGTVLRMVVAYRERYGITDHTPLGAKPDATQQRLDHERIDGFLTSLRRRGTPPATPEVTREGIGR